jgi:hypothetical protein
VNAAETKYQSSSPTTPTIQQWRSFALINQNIDKILPATPTLGIHYDSAMSTSNSPGNVFLTPEGGITPTSFLLLIGTPLFVSGRFIYGGVVCAIAFLVAIKASMEEIKEVEKQEMRYAIFEPEDLLAELEAIEESNEDAEKKHAKCLASLSALAKKYTKNEREKDLGLLCQQAAYSTLNIFPEDVEITAGSISLLALVAKDPEVRKRNKYQADVYGFNHPIRCLQKTLEKAKKVQDEEKEELMAEILRKGCLYMGAIADGDKDLDLALKIVEEDGLELILDAANWFRLHEGVANWALWAIFVLNYEHVRNKVQLVRLGGVATVCQLLKNNPNSLEVNRHGVAVLFDVLREGQHTEAVKFDPWEVRRLALSAGLHDVLLNAMTEFSDSMDIMMMAQEMLIGTGYRGDIPRFQKP